MGMDFSGWRDCVEKVAVVPGGWGCELVGKPHLLPWRKAFSGCGHSARLFQVLSPRERFRRGRRESLRRLQCLSVGGAPTHREDVGRVHVLPEVVGIGVAVKVEAEPGP